MTTSHLLPAYEMERTSVVADNTMNREGGLAGVNSWRQREAVSRVPAWHTRSR
ncbi:hypothetical protein ACIQNK_27425 [Streptomyces sp. NPDC091273]|uniref:hypothetical protein n=1 Tax=Streptomyces sp. NPDC091273 TaxID=3365982 RepID=UPI003808B183